MTAIQVGGGRVAGLDAERLAAEFGTPLYVYDLDAIAERVSALAAALPPAFSLAFAAKANPSLAVLNLFAELGLGLDVASAGELEAGRRAGVASDRIVFTGPGKTDAELGEAAQVGLRAVTVESATELARLERAAADIGRVVPILLRVAVHDGAEEVPILGSGWRKFGIDPGELGDVARRAQASPWLDLLGIHAFGASNVLDAGEIVAHVARTVDLAACLARDIGFSLRLVDVGGGLGVPYGDGEPELDLTRLGSGLARLAAAWEADAALGDLSVLVEPGRYLTAPCGLLLTRVVDTKRVGGRAVVIVDAGLHHALRPALLGTAHRLRLVANDPGSAATEPVMVAGPLCTGLDVFPGALPEVPEPGDPIAVCDLGAYGFTESMPYFLSHPIPAEVVVRGGRAHPARRRVEPGELLEMQHIAVG
ncbi:MAG TPA: diaminopimelate decarboxylase [Candidatus Binatia bacterium]|nr:diaminopimelate decarboxylase [Candidatus Binatia bacterium]